MQSTRSGQGASLRRNVLRIPAIRALSIQVLSAVLVLAAAMALPVIAEVQLSVALAALLQGVAAASMSRLFRMAPWWLLIQFLFPVALLMLHALHLPSWIYLASFLVLLCLYWTTFRTQVPYYPSTRLVWDEVNALLPHGQAIRFIDIGRGFGGLVMHLSQLRSDGEFVGIEVAPMPWLVSRIRARTSGCRADFVRGDYQSIDFAGFDVVFAYLSPAAMPDLWDKARAEMRHGALLLSYEFPIPGVEPNVIRQPVRNGPLLYGWRL
jgi:SAM-dependent methyltransferase